MPNLQHVYLTAHGLFTAGAWNQETAQIGLRLAFAPKTDPVAKGSTFTMQDNGEVVPDTGTQAGANGTLTRTWSARIGAIGSGDNMDATQQIDLAQDFRTFLVALQAYQSTGFQWTHIKIAPIAAAGSYAAPSSVYTFSAPVPGAAGAGNHSYPPEVALAVSFRAPVIGRTGRGRFYIPGLHTAAGALDGTVGGAATTAILAAGVSLVTNVQNMTGITEYDAIVAVTSAGKATAVRPTQVRVGNHFDSQRRRQQQQPEVYTSTAL